MKSVHLLSVLILLGIVASLGVQGIASYTKWAFVLLVLPSIFFVFRKESSLDKEKFALICVGALIATLFWDYAAIHLGIWDFPRHNVSGWLFGIPLEEYVFGICFSAITLGVYTSLPHFREKLYDGPRIREIPLLAAVSIMEFVLLMTLLFSDAQSYFKWLLVFAIVPSLFYLWRRGEKIDEVRLAITILIGLVVCIPLDLIFIGSGSWFYHESALLWKIGRIPVEDLLFVIFTSITVVGLYTSLPKKRLFSGSW